MIAASCSSPVIMWLSQDRMMTLYMMTAMRWYSCFFYWCTHNYKVATGDYINNTFVASEDKIKQHKTW